MRSAQPALHHLATLLMLFFLTGNAGADWRSCLSVSDEAQRLSCYDDYARSLQGNAASAEKDFGKTPLTPAKEVDSIDAVIIEVEYRSRGKRVFYLDNGQAWIQVANSSQPKLQSSDRVKNCQVLIDCKLSHGRTILS